MPGILPMKVIKVGSGSQTRIAQACDRCRSKKIRCDGVRPCCTQCANVGFECKTSDKLSRRAFPRGYTESLEERVRQLEAELRELKDLLDEKDEKIDMLSRIHSSTSPNGGSRRRSSTAFSHPQLADAASAAAAAAAAAGEDSASPRDEFFKVQQSPQLLHELDSDSYFMGTSSGRAFVDAFKRRLQESGKPCADINAAAFFADRRPSISPQLGKRPLSPPPHMLSDQCVNIFFQEWAPLFPVIHRPTFLVAYDHFKTDPDAVKEPKALAQLYLVFGVAALSNHSQDARDTDKLEAQWQRALDKIIDESNLAVLQCLILAQIFCIQKGDHVKLLRYKGSAVALAYRLGLNQSQKRFAFGALTRETRKKVFWTLYTLDCFSAAVLGLPKHIKEDDVHCEYPTDADDEYVTEKGFLPSLPGEYTKLSSALALFRGARILGKVLDENYPAAATHEISLKSLGVLSEELDEWSNNLAPHLRLIFAHDKPSTNVTGSRSPILSLTYHFIRTMIHRPAVCASREGNFSSSVVAMAASSKHIVQILQLLEERGLSFSICLNKNELLAISGFGILFQVMELGKDSKTFKDGQKLIRAVADMLDQCHAHGSAEFRSLASSLLGFDQPAPISTPSSLTRQEPTASSNLLAPPAKSGPRPKSSRHSSSSSDKHRPLFPKEARRATEPDALAPSHVGQRSSKSQTSTNSTRSEPALSPSAHHHRPATAGPSKQQQQQQQQESIRRRSNATPPSVLPVTNLDYMPFGDEPVPSMPHPLQNRHHDVTTDDWERLLSKMEYGPTNIYDNIYGGLPCDALRDASDFHFHSLSPPQRQQSQEHRKSEPPVQLHHMPSAPALSSHSHDPNSPWSPSDLWAFSPDDFSSTSGGGGGPPAAPALSVLSASDVESWTSGSGDEILSYDGCCSSSCTSTTSTGPASTHGGDCPSLPPTSYHKSIMMPNMDTPEESDSPDFCALDATAFAL